MNNTPTPRTTLRYEADKYDQGAFSAYENMRDLAMELERELAEAIESREFQLKLNVELNEREKQNHARLIELQQQLQTMQEQFDNLLDQRDKLSAAIERLKELPDTWRNECQGNWLRGGVVLQLADDFDAAVKGGADES